MVRMVGCDFRHSLRSCNLLIKKIIFFVIFILFFSEMETRFTKGKSAILERPLARAKTEVSVSAFALLFSEMVQYCQSRVYSVAELQGRLADMGQGVGASLLDVLVMREKNGKRETKVLNILLFIKVCSPLKFSLLQPEVIL